MSHQTRIESQKIESNAITLLQSATWLVAATMVGLATAGIVLLYLQLNQVCLAPVEICARTMQLAPSNLAGVQSPEAILQFHAVWRAGLNAISRITCWLLAWLILRHRGRDVMGLVTALWLFTYGAPFDLFATATAFPALMPVVLFLFALNGVCFGLFLTLFPRGNFAPRWSLAIFGLWVLSAISDLFPSISFGLTQPAQVRLLLTNTVLYGSVLLLQIYRYRKLLDQTERLQTKWVLFGMAVWLVLSLFTRWIVAVTYDPAAPVSPMFYLSGIGFPLAALTLPVTIAIAILRYRLFDIDLILNRTLVYGVLTAFVIGVYTLIVGGIGALLQLEGTTLLSLLATGLVAVAFNPLRERVQRIVNRIIYGQRDEPYAVTAQLGRSMETSFLPDQLYFAIAETIGEALKLAQVELVLEGEQQVTKWHGERVNPTTFRAYPLSYQGEQLGELRVMPRPGETLSDADHRLLEDLARQAAIAVRAARTTIELQHSRERIVVAREEERRRIRRDLHDGLGPQLASQSLKLETVYELIPTQPERAQAVLADLLVLSQKMVGEIRQLVYALRPPALDDFGLVGAIQELIVRIGPSTTSVELHAPNQLPPLPAAVEVAVYRIAQEAITNVVKHAHATAATVKIDIVTICSENDTLLLEISDNGCGLVAGGPSGVGLHSMRERAGELDGVVRILPNEPQGTVVRVELPLIRAPG